ncbi:IS110 family transposase [Pedosphaera parvula]|uniref:Transposase IS116/IS110/IS902 family protein n=1 Tax=Pedosphaera parvula (strain Ellin514) TaxID=320771 RepID=B9XEN0_PEDPL|nr:IS110 family transposase [Pedosphaera parvula]EEF61744.1 transposase IS116/IS110/IS902 family protein [Pedosphaera parvula Ellin514]
MKKQTNTNTHPTTSTQNAPKAKSIKLGIDVHADSYRVVRQVDHATPQPAQKFTPQDFLVWVKKQLSLAEKVYTCYEAGPFGYGLHRKLAELGITNYVICPQNWDERGKGVKTDKTDALALAQRLSSYVQGNERSLAIVRVPTPEEELARAESRQREQLQAHKLRLEAQGRSLLLYHGVRIKGRWWLASHWEKLCLQISPRLQQLLSTLRELVLAVQDHLKSATRDLKEKATPQPYGLGALTSQVIKREILSWDRFKNRRQVASYTGLCPGVHASGERHRHGPITRHGNKRLRTALIEMAWRLLRFQSKYRPIERRRVLLTSTKAGGGAKQKAIVAIGRQLAIDLWRLGTGRTTPEKLGLRMAA